MKKKLAIGLILGLAAVSILGIAGCNSNSNPNGSVYVYNWGEYLDPQVIDLFEEETGIKVVYDEFETNEVMYPKV